MNEIKRIYFSIDAKQPSFGPIAVYVVDNIPGKVIPKDVKYVMSLRSKEEIALAVEEGSFHYYWGHLDKGTREKFIRDMFDFKITVVQSKKSE